MCAWRFSTHRSFQLWFARFVSSNGILIIIVYIYSSGYLLANASVQFFLRSLIEKKSKRTSVMSKWEISSRFTEGAGAQVNQRNHQRKWSKQTLYLPSLSSSKSQLPIRSKCHHRPSARRYRQQLIILQLQSSRSATCDQIFSFSLSLSWLFRLWGDSSNPGTKHKTHLNWDWRFACHLTCHIDFKT
jgi:hypothetical protein